MPALWWLAIAGLPVFQQPLPDAVGTPAVDSPAVLALATGQVSVRAPCYQLVCPDAQWSAPNRYTALFLPQVPGTRQPLRVKRPSPLASRRHARLYAPISRRDWFANEISEAKVGTTYAIEALRRPGTDVRLQVGTGYRLTPYSGYGTSAIGVIARGGLHLSQDLGDRVAINQQLQVETGRYNTFTRQVLGVDFRLQDQWLLQSSIETNHDSAGGGNTDTRGSLKLRYTF